jgi:elongation factor 1-alpha
MESKDETIISDIIYGENKTQPVTIALAGSVDAGKSSLFGVLLTDKLDNGKGSARNEIAKHKHEIESGRTSDITSKVVNIDGTDLHFTDLCGHEKYLKTTLAGITGSFFDYGIVMVGANRGVLTMTEEHLAILFHMKIPFIILISKIDFTPYDIYERTINNIRRICKALNRKPLFIGKYAKSDSSVDKTGPVETYLEGSESIANNILRKCAKDMKNNIRTVPVISISNKTGYHISVVRRLMKELKPRELWDKEDIDGSIFSIDGVFTPPGVGLVVSGTVKGKDIVEGSTMIIGPIFGNYPTIKVWSIHNNKSERVKVLSDREKGCLAIKFINKKDGYDRHSIRRGAVVLSSKELTKNTCYEFTARILILRHPTSISEHYTPVIHCGSIRQSARIIIIDVTKNSKNINEGKVDETEKTILRTYDKAIVRFHFLQRPEFVEIGKTFMFREGTTRGRGEVIDVVPLGEEWIDIDQDTFHVNDTELRKKMLSGIAESETKQTEETKTKDAVKIDVDETKK